MRHGNGLHDLELWVTLMIPKLAKAFCFYITKKAKPSTVVALYFSTHSINYNSSILLLDAQKINGSNFIEITLLATLVVVQKKQFQFSIEPLHEKTFSHHC